MPEGSSIFMHFTLSLSLLVVVVAAQKAIAQRAEVEGFGAIERDRLRSK